MTTKKSQAVLPTHINIILMAVLLLVKEEQPDDELVVEIPSNYPLYHLRLRLKFPPNALAEPPEYQRFINIGNPYDEIGAYPIVYFSQVTQGGVENKEVHFATTIYYGPNEQPSLVPKNRATVKAAKDILTFLTTGILFGQLHPFPPTLESVPA